MTEWSEHFWFLRDCEGNFCPQISAEIPSTRNTWRLSFGIGLDPGRCWFSAINPETMKAVASFHWYFGGWGLAGWPTFRRWPENE